MERNEDEHIVIMDVEMYEQMNTLAGIGAAEVGREKEIDSLRKHVRRFNVHIKNKFLKEMQHKLDVRKFYNDATIKFCKKK